MFFPFLVILPGLIALSLTAGLVSRRAARRAPAAAMARPIQGPLDPAVRAAAAPQSQAIIPVKIDPATGKPAVDQTGGRCSTTTSPRPTC